MSFEGYTQSLCANGHLSTYEVWDDWEKCAICHSTQQVWSNIVDDTNSEEYGIVLMDQYKIKEGKSEINTFVNENGDWVTVSFIVHPQYSAPPKDCTQYCRVLGRYEPIT